MSLESINPERQELRRQRSGVPLGSSTVQCSPLPVGVARSRRYIPGGLCNFIRFMIRPSNNREVNFLMVVILLFALICIVLIGMNMWLLHELGTRDKYTMPKPEVVVDVDAITGIWQLYETVLQTNKDSDKELLYQYLLKCRQKAAPHGTSMQAGSGISFGGTATRTSRSEGAGGSPSDLPRVLDELQKTIGIIAAQEPNDGLEGAASFIHNLLSFAPGGNTAGQSGDDGTADSDGVPNYLLSTAGAQTETEANAPFDDILYWQLYLFFSSGESSGATKDAHAWWERIQHTAPSVITARFYYPLRRYHNTHRFPSETPTTASLWYDAIAYDYFGNDAEPFTPPVGDAQVAGVLASNAELNTSLVSRTHSGTLFLNIASYRDPECWRTVQHAVGRAVNMFRVYVGIAEQHRSSDLSCIAYEALAPQACLAPGSSAETLAKSAGLNTAVCFPADNIRVRRITPAAANGPTYGRYMAMLLYRGEDYTLVLDSHIRFVYAWDSRLAALYIEMQHPRLVLTHYPESYNASSGSHFVYERKTTVYLCRATFIDSVGYVRLKGIVMDSADAVLYMHEEHVKDYPIPHLSLSPNVKRPLPQPWASGGFLFANGSIMREVPFDPHLPNLFDGEEVLYSVRLWTHGYDIHSPKNSTSFHIYTRGDQPKVWDNNPQWESTQRRTHKRVQFLLRSYLKGISVPRIPRETADPEVTVDVDRYGVGRARTVDDWYRFAGLDPVRYTVDGRWCGREMSRDAGG
ncbi:putative Glycosyltransferase (GlcNAc) [Trypanosoma vivax]|uniref:Glycosyltransferase (GlcNAc) n=1 Tax=Trypanosoma vivax (strain Y486) TaxID=1055687 RepID=G0TRQ2_TRYVY|nr:hypothetical protein TRVL_04908 [Trypanosoma vivax]KAH8608106.1 putative Glycosyltransferase (GlcNAc) [Trypanosoma vivax]CCC46624.1 conserved hypothetical protein [Trypanosoma vivax Y486]